MVKRGELGNLAALWMEGRCLSVRSELMGRFYRVRRAASSLQLQPDEPVVASSGSTKTATLAILMVQQRDEADVAERRERELAQLVGPDLPQQREHAAVHEVGRVAQVARLPRRRAARRAAARLAQPAPHEHARLGDRRLVLRRLARPRARGRRGAPSQNVALLGAPEPTERARRQMMRDERRVVEVRDVLRAKQDRLLGAGKVARARVGREEEVVVQVEEGRGDTRDTVQHRLDRPRAEGGQRTRRLQLWLENGAVRHDR